MEGNSIVFGVLTINRVVAVARGRCLCMWRQARGLRSVPSTITDHLIFLRQGLSLHTEFNN